MGVAYFIEVEKKIEGMETFVDGKALANAKESILKKICKKAGVKELMDFFSADPDEMAEFLDDYGRDQAFQLPDESWFSAEEGLATVEALIDHLTQNENVLKSQPMVLEDLEAFKHILTQLKDNQVGWHLAIDI